MTILLVFFALQIVVASLALLKLISQKLMVNILRFSYAGFLIFSGSVKLIDPLGFSYKLQEYFEVFGMEFLIPLSLFLSISIILFEILLGLFLIYGYQVKKVMWGNLLLMGFFTFLTFFSAYFDKVTDCGCFGDFMKLDPWHSFLKDIHLLFVSVVLFVFQDKIKPLLSSFFPVQGHGFKLTKQLLFVKFLVFLFIPIYTLSHLPFVDFRAYSLGKDVVQGRELPPDAKKDIYEDLWYYEINGEVRQFFTSESPWDIEGAVFKDRVTKLVSKGDEPPIHDFDLIDPLTETNITDSILNMEKVLLLVSYDIDKVNIGGYMSLLNKLVTVLESQVPIYGLSSSSTNEISSKLSNENRYFNWLLVDQTTLKTMVRANPGVILLEKGVIVNKWHWRDFDKIDL